MNVDREIRRAVEKAMACRHRSGFTCRQLNCGTAQARPLITAKLIDRYHANDWTCTRAETDVAGVLGEVFYRQASDRDEVTRIVAAINGCLPKRMRFTAPAGPTPQPS